MKTFSLVVCEDDQRGQLVGIGEEYYYLRFLARCDLVQRLEQAHRALRIDHGKGDATSHITQPHFA